MPKLSGKQKYKNSQAVTHWLFLAPSILGVAIFYVIPFVIVLYYSSVDNPISHRLVYFQNFVNVIRNSAFKLAAKNTATFSLVSVPLAVVISLLMAMMLESKLYARSALRTLFLSPMMVPVASIVLIWQVLFHYNGTINQVLAAVGLRPIDWFKSDYNQFVVVILFLWKSLGYNMILFMSALGSVPTEQLEAATIDGATNAQRFFWIKLRYIASTAFFVTILSLINSFKVFREVYLLTGDYPYNGLYMLQHFMNNVFRSLDYQKLSAAAVIMALFMVAIIWLLFTVEDKLGKDIEG